MGKGNFKGYVLVLLTAGLLAMSGCGSSSSDSTPAASTGGDTTGGDTTVSYAGDATISGTIDTSRLSSADQTATRSRARSSRDGETELVRLYVINADGTEQDANITCTIDTAGAYECPGVANGQDFITRYVKDLGGGEVLELKAPVKVPATGNPDPITVDPITTMIVGAIVEAVTKAVTGVTSDTELIETILASVVDAITTTMTTLVEAGTIQIPSMVVEADFTEIQENNATEAVVNTNLGDAVGIVNSSDEVENVVTAVKKEKASETFAQATPAEQVQAALRVLGWEEDVPGWVEAVFTGEFNNVEYTPRDTNGDATGATVAMTFKKFFELNNLIPKSASTNMAPMKREVVLTPEEMLAECLTTFTQEECDAMATNDGGDMTTDGGTTMDGGDSGSTDGGGEYNVLNDIYTDATDISTLATTIATEINTIMNDGTLFDGMLAEVRRYHAIAAIPFADRNASAKEFMLHFDPTIGILFDAAFTASATFESEISNMAQAMLMIGYLDSRDGVVADLVKEKVKVALADAVYFESQLGHIGEFLFDDGKDTLIFAMFSNAVMQQYDEPSIGFLEVQQQGLWDPTTGTQSDALAIRTGLDSLLWMDGIPAADLAVIEGNVTYPTTDGSMVTVALEAKSHDGHSYFGIEPYECTDQYDPSTCGPSANPITDFGSGEFTVAFDYNGTIFTKTREMFFVKDSYKYIATLISPKGQPRWNPEWDNFYQNQNDFNQSEQTRIQAEIDAFNVLQNEYWANGAPTIAPNTDTDGDDVNDTLVDMLIKWEAPDLGDVVLPDGVGIAYSVQVNLFEPKFDPNTGTDECWTNWDSCNKKIYNSWDEDKLITTTSITLPVDLEVTDEGTTNNWERKQYDLSVNVVFIDKSTGREVAHGGWNNAQFIVGESQALTGTEVITVTGEVKLGQHEYFDAETGTKMTEDAQMPANFNVVAIAETWGETENASGEMYWTSTKNVIATGEFNSTNNTYAISTTWAELEAELNHNTNIQIIGYSDENNNSTYDPIDWNAGPDENGTWRGDYEYWPEGGMWINTFGDKVINVDMWDHETGTHDSDSYRIKKDENTTVEGFDIKIW